MVQFVALSVVTDNSYASRLPQGIKQMKLFLCGEIPEKNAAIAGFARHLNRIPLRRFFQFWSSSRYQNRRPPSAERPFEL
jgi:hypothetical protein